MYIYSEPTLLVFQYIYINNLCLRNEPHQRSTHMLGQDALSLIEYFFAYLSVLSHLICRTYQNRKHCLIFKFLWQNFQHTISPPSKITFASVLHQNIALHNHNRGQSPITRPINGQRGGIAWFLAPPQCWWAQLTTPI